MLTENKFDLRISVLTKYSYIYKAYSKMLQRAWKLATKRKMQLQFKYENLFPILFRDNQIFNYLLC